MKVFENISCTLLYMFIQGWFIVFSKYIKLYDIVYHVYKTIEK